MIRKLYESPPRALVAFVAVYLAFDVLPIALPGSGVLEGLSWGDLIDAPLAFLLVAAYALLCAQAGLFRVPASQLLTLVALVMVVQGHGIHLAANAIARYLDSDAPGRETAYFLDEHWGHFELHAGILLLALLFIAASHSRSEPPARAKAAAVTLAAIVYGLALTADAIEGQTVALMLPAAAGLSLLGRLHTGSGFSWHRSFFASALTVTVIALVSYGIWQGGFPEHDWDVWRSIL